MNVEYSQGDSLEFILSDQTEHPGFDSNVEHLSYCQNCKQAESGTKFVRQLPGTERMGHVLNEKLKHFSSEDRFRRHKGTGGSVGSVI